MRRLILILASLVLLPSCATGEKLRLSTVREIWELGGRGRIHGYSKQGSGVPYVAWSQIVFFDDMTYKRVFFIKQQGLKHSVESQVGKWDGTNAAEIARQKFTDYPTGWELDTDGDEIGWHVLYNYQHTSVYPAEKDMANKMLEADRQKGGAK